MIGECPHCFHRVATRPDGICPNCQKDVRDTSTLDPNKSPLVIRSRGKMPETCCLCGNSTRRMAKVARTESRMVEPQSGFDYISLAALFSILLMVFSGFGLLFLLFPGNKPAASQHVLDELSFQVPRCDACASEEIQIAGVNFDRGTMRLNVHKQFISRYRELNPANSQQFPSG